LVHSAQCYGDDTLEYPADDTGTWTIKLDMFPGWDTTKWPDNYFLYGSGPYELELSIESTAAAPPTPAPQPEIQPVAQTFAVTNDPDSQCDEYAYIAAIPAANYIKDGSRYVSPIIYTGDTTPTHWFGTVDDTTQYLVDDWNTYLSRHNTQATTHQLQDNPVTAAANLATTQWTAADTAVIAIDGSGFDGNGDFEDEVDAVLDTTATLLIQDEVVTTSPA
jgi:hypothetical protein